MFRSTVTSDSLPSLVFGSPPVATGPQPAPTDPEDPVDAEWRKLEAERITEERDEAVEDALDAPSPPARWPWWAFAAALAAGVILAVLINSPAMRSGRPATDPPEMTAK
jgi:hypothetical protein